MNSFLPSTLKPKNISRIHEWYTGEIKLGNIICNFVRSCTSNLYVFAFCLATLYFFSTFFGSTVPLLPNSLSRDRDFGYGRSSVRSTTTTSLFLESCSRSDKASILTFFIDNKRVSPKHVLFMILFCLQFPCFRSQIVYLWMHVFELRN